jgi:hypothetical protein
MAFEKGMKEAKPMLLEPTFVAETAFLIPLGYCIINRTQT